MMPETIWRSERRVRGLALRLGAVFAATLAIFIATANDSRPRDAEAAFHFALIEEAMFGKGGDPTIQYVEIEMLAAGQNVVQHSVLGYFNASGVYQGDILKVPANVPNAISNARWIMATAAFVASNPNTTPDFIFTPVASMPATGMLCWGGGGQVFPLVEPPVWDRTNMLNWVDCIPYGGYQATPNKYGTCIDAPNCFTPFGLGDGAQMSLTRVSLLGRPMLDWALACPTPESNQGAVGYNHDNHIDLPAPRTFDDLTWINADTVGDNCGDSDDDNDGFTDNSEGLIAPGDPENFACPTTTADTDSLKLDTDGDRRTDRAECLLGSNPVDPLSFPPTIVMPDLDMDGVPNSLDPNSGAVDTDLDGVRDGVEFRFYGSNLSSTNSDGDICADAKELATVDRNTTVNAADLGLVASGFGPSTAPQYIVDFDIDKNGTINAADLGQVAARFGGC